MQHVSRVLSDSTKALPHAIRRVSEIGVDNAVIGGKVVPIQEQLLIERPFSGLLRFQMDSADKRPRVLLVAPLSGMRSTILYDMILAMLRGYEVHCLTWRDAADVPLEHGPFGLDDNIADVVETLCRLYCVAARGVTTRQAVHLGERA